MTSSYGNSFSTFGQGLTGFDEFAKSNNLFSKSDSSDSQFYRGGNVNVLEPISVFASSNIDDNRYKSLQCENYNQINCNDSSRTNMVPSKSMPHFPNFGFNDSRLEASPESFDWSMVSFSAGIEAKIHETSMKYQFEHALIAQTSSAVKINQESLTYLNQGQCYEIKLKCLKGYEQHQFFKSIIRVIFHERRLQYSEKELIEIWKSNRPGERIIDIDIPECCGLVNVEVDPDSLNSIGFIWNPSKPTGIFVKIQCISTEFTANKHGGEKGVPLRIKVETYSISDKGDARDEKLIQCSSCQIKVFKPKGADRKHKRDIEKLGKLNHIERNQLRIPEIVTPLREMCLDQDLFQPQFGIGSNVVKPSHIPSIHKTPQSTPQSISNGSTSHQTINNCEGLLNVNYRDFKRGESFFNNRAANYGTHGSEINTSFFGRGGNCASEELDNDDAFLTDNNNNNNSNTSMTTKHEIMSEEAARLLLSCIPVVNEITEETHLVSRSNVKDMNPEQLVQWLTTENFEQHCKHFESFTGAELLRLSQDDLISICGPAEGIRLHNLLHFGFTKPKLSIYVNFQGVSNLYTRYKNSQHSNHQCLDAQAHSKNSLIGSLSHNNLTPSIGRLTDEEKMEEDEDNDHFLPPHSFHHLHKQPMLRSVSLSSVRMYPYHNPRNNNNNNNHFVIGSSHNDPRRRHCVNVKSRPQSEDHGYMIRSSNNVQHHGSTLEELNRNAIFHPIDLEVLSVKNLRDKLSVIFNVPVQQEQQIYFEQFGIQILASDDHLQNIPNHSKFVSQIIRCSDSPNTCDILLKMMPNKTSYFQL